jgi:asparagine synthase (glutamine-hydrolysing)
MCSIAGTLYLSDRSLPPLADLESRVAGALGVMHRRGPDESSTAAVSRRCVMGGNRLIIRGGVGLGSMPFRSRGGLAFYNGEIYNYRRWQPDAPSDGCVVLPAYEEYGLDCFARFEGEFAVAIWDDRNGTLILGRDPFGSKPLYFSHDGHRISWASSPSAIARMEPHGFCAAVKSSVHDFTQSPQEPYTSYRGIWQLPPGHVLVARGSDVGVYAYHRWKEARADGTDPQEVFEALDRSLRQRLDHEGVLGIPMSGGIDSGIIAFMADRLGVRYHLFSVVETLGRPTAEAPYIHERLKRLRRPHDVTLLSCDGEAYERALEEIYAPDYYGCEYFDPGAIPMHTVVAAMHRAGIRVAVEGSGGDELFHGYEFRGEFGPVPEWPAPWRKVPYFYSMFTTLLSWTAKTDRAGGHFSIETRFPFQSVGLALAGMRLAPSPVLKWPLRRFLLEKLDYGPATDADRSAKFGFTLEHTEKRKVVEAMQRAWCRANGLRQLPREPASPFPFVVGRRLAEIGRGRDLRRVSADRGGSA